MQLQEYIDEFHDGNLSDFARKADLYPMSVCRYVKGVIPSGVNLQKVCEATAGKVSLADFLKNKKTA